MSEAEKSFDEKSFKIHCRVLNFLLFLFLFFCYYLFWFISQWIFVVKQIEEKLFMNNNTYTTTTMFLKVENGFNERFDCPFFGT